MTRETLYLSAFDDDGVGGEVDTPSERGCRNKELDVPIGKKIFDQSTVDTAHTGVMDGETVWKQVFELLILHLLRFVAEDFGGGRAFSEERPQ